MRDCRPDYTIAPGILNLVAEMVEAISHLKGRIPKLHRAGA